MLQKLYTGYETGEKEVNMELKERLYIIKKRLLLIILIILAVTLSSGILSCFVIKPKYKADISIIIGNTQSTVSDAATSYYDIMMYQTMANTFSKLVKSRTVADDVIQKLNLQSIKDDDLLSLISVTPDKDTQFVTISVISKNAEQAMNIANQFAQSLKDISKKVYKTDMVMIIDNAKLPSEPYSPKPIIDIGIAFLISTLFSVGLAFLLEYLDNTIKSKEDVETVVGIPVIGTISLVKMKYRDVIVC